MVDDQITTAAELEALMDILGSVGVAHAQLRAHYAEAILAAGFHRPDRPSGVSREKVEDVARAIFCEEQCDRNQAKALDENWHSRLDDRDQNDYRDLARAAIAALGLPVEPEPVCTDAETCHCTQHAARKSGCVWCDAAVSQMRAALGSTIEDDEPAPEIPGFEGTDEALAGLTIRPKGEESHE